MHRIELNELRNSTENMHLPFCDPTVGHGIKIIAFTGTGNVKDKIVWNDE